MLLIAISLSLLVIYAGATLMYYTQREVAGKFYKFISIFIMMMGLLGVLCESTVLVLHLCGYSHHKKNHCRMNMPHRHTISVTNRDSTMQMYHHGRCCPHIYCTEHASDYGEESIFYPKDCVCCPDGSGQSSADSIQ